MRLISNLLIVTSIFLNISCLKFKPIPENENLPNILKPSVLNQKNFELKYPSNWEYKDDKDNLLNTDFQSYLIESNGNSYVQILVYDPPMDNESCVEEFKTEMEEDLIETENTELRNSWGKQNGYGVKLSGKILFLKQGSINIFCFTEKNNTYSIIEFYYEEDFETIKTGLFLIQSSFKLF